MNRKKLSLIIILTLIISSYFVLDLNRYINFEYLQNEYLYLNELFTQHKTIFIFLYSVSYIAITAASLPGALVLTLLAGALFGAGLGLILVSISSTIGACIAFIISRYLLKDLVQQRYTKALAKMNKGVDSEGAYYLFTLRLIPIFPFFMINWLMGLTTIRLFTYSWVSWLGMLPGTVLFVLAGNELAQISNPKDILSIHIIVLFTLIGIAPLFFKRLLGAVKAHSILRPYSKPKNFDYNIIVIGAGSAGLVCANVASSMKAKVALVEKNKMGGDCLNTGCVPSKTLLKSSKIANYIRRSEHFGIHVKKYEIDFTAIMNNIRDTIKKIEPHDSVERYTKLGVDCIKGKATIIDPYRVEIDKQTISAKKIVIATGSKPIVPEIPGIKDIEYLTSDTIWDLKQKPKSLVILGGGAIGCEIAQAFSRLGTHVTIIEGASSILSREDEDVIHEMRKCLHQERVCILESHKAIEFKSNAAEPIIVCQKDTHIVEVPFEKILIAIGRKIVIPQHNLELLCKITKKPLANEYMQTPYPNIFICGDAYGSYQLTSAAGYQGGIAAFNSIMTPWHKVQLNETIMPMAVFTDPEIARVGLNEKQAQQNEIGYEITKFSLDELDRNIIENKTNGFIKILTQSKSDRILGVTIVGSHSSELLNEFVSAMQNNKGLKTILKTKHVYPSFSEANRNAATQWQKQRIPGFALRVLKWWNRL